VQQTEGAGLAVQPKKVKEDLQDNLLIYWYENRRKIEILRDKR